MTRKSDLPVKTCARCGRPFTWRRKWARVWDEVRYCSDRCRGARNGVTKHGNYRNDGSAGIGEFSGK
ncbi:DUF2256 domain-containing protein [Phaeovulum vinaykumarii]|uniref:DUF2256 domain-containing protein n=1 Tax=Phaeovulum vinaykumarii TaxID=407234 RepID=UPI001F249B36|nr:DUF2256 domain-containing protein [Phaeovulum vinaykumarii]